MRLQYALDFLEIEAAISAMSEVDDMIDIVEAGTPLLLNHGLQVVSSLKNAFPNKQILADTKIVCCGKTMAEAAFKAGADIVTVMGYAPFHVKLEVIESAKFHGGACVIDSMQVENIPVEATNMVKAGAAYVFIHNATDALNMDKIIHLIRQLSDVIPSEHIAVGGGINEATIEKLAPFDMGIMVIGSAITHATDKHFLLHSLIERYHNAQLQNR